jgi:hypothetical protein
MLELGCAIDLPVFEAVPETESSFPIQRILANGIDIKFRRASIQQKCEEAYFRRLLEENSGLVGIGPHLIDRTLGDSRYVAEVRPDSMLFEPRYRFNEVIFPEEAVVAQQTEPKEIELVLVTLVEFKIKGMNGFHRKINGFSRLLERLREDPNIFKRLINGLDPSFDLPSIVIPPDDKIKVRFISTNDRDVPPNDSAFQIEHKTIPLPQKYLTLLAQALETPQQTPSIL